MPGTVKVLIKSVVLVPVELLGETHMQLCFSYQAALGDTVWKLQRGAPHRDWGSGVVSWAVA